MVDNVKSVLSTKRRTRAYYAFVFMLYAFLLRDPLEQCLVFFKYFDEALALAAIPVLFLRISKNRGIQFIIDKHGYWKYLIITFCIGFLGNLVFRYQPLIRAAFPDAFLFLKFWLWVEVAKYVFRDFDVVCYSKRVFRHVRFVAWFYLLLTILDNVVHIFPADLRHGLRSTILFYFHPTSFAACMIFLMSVLVLVRAGLNKKQFYLYEIILSGLACSSMRSKVLGTVLLFWLLIYIILIRRKKITVWIMLLFVPLVVLVGWEQIQFYFLSDMIQGSARYQLLTKSFMVANKHFPLGAGFSTFASYYSGVYYSPLYKMFGISNVYGMTATNTSFISDSFWPMVLGQTGYIGTASFVLAIYMLYRKIQKTRLCSKPIYVSGLFTLAYLLVESTSSAAFVHPIYLPMSFVLAYVLNNSKPINKASSDIV